MRSVPGMSRSDERDVVRRGYDALSYHYRSDDADDGQYAPWLAGLHQRLPASAAVLDLGCGCGVPVARFLANAGHRVTGVDISDVQIERARRLVPDGTFLRADATRLDLPPASFDAVVCLYAFIHMPLADQPQLIKSIATWLRPGGWLLTTVGNTAWTGTEDNWLDGPATMWWSHADASSYRSWLRQAGLTIIAEDFVPEGSSAHALFWAQRPQG
ncbi:Methyltransferase domain-containing protein [Micromonospora saelicesensis]|uniref:Methyltransferase domain-containing protein n=2 Tax=Micromonospora saelicesensis TaxID=285676 RepID=A0A1C4YH23_9ACTN|nr:Methyltransferase domain-containing protein [Micromonospora saelicesensis]